MYKQLHRITRILKSRGNKRYKPQLLLKGFKEEIIIIYIKLIKNGEKIKMI